MTPDREQGYATLAVTALMAALSVVAIAWLDRAGTGSHHALLVRNTLTADAAIEGLFSEVAAGLVNRTISVGSTGAVLDRTYAGVRASVRIDPMQNRVDLNRAPIDAIDTRARESRLPPEVIADLLEGIRENRFGAGSTIAHIDGLSDSQAFQEALACLRRQFTVFHNAALPRTRPNDHTLPDGSLVRIHITTRDPPARGLDAVILLTGSSSEPVWIYDWRRFSDPQKEICDESI